MNHTHQTTYINDDEIDLRELALTLWRQKALIITCTIVVTAVAAAYAWFAPKVYQTSVTLLPPTLNDLASYNALMLQLDLATNKANQKEQEGEKAKVDQLLTSRQAFDIFTRHVQSSHLKQAFFNDVYLPELNSAAALDSADTSQKNALWNRFNAQLSITHPKGTERLVVELQGDNPQRITHWVNTYVEAALQRSQAQAEQMLQGQLDNEASKLKAQIDAYRQSGEEERLFRIARLEEALQLAINLGIDSLPNSGNFITSYTGETTYLRGARALQAELQLLQARTNNDPYIPELASLKQQQKLVAQTTIQPETLALATVDSWAIEPLAPIKPKKKLILALGFLLGGMLGVFSALVRVWWKNDTSQRVAQPH